MTDKDAPPPASEEVGEMSPAGWLLTWKDATGVEHTDFSLTKEEAEHTDRQLERYLTRYAGPGVIRPVYAAAPPPASEVDAASPVREQIHSAIRAFTSATVAEADAAALAIIRIVRNAAPRGVTWPPKGYDHNQPGGFDGPTGAD